MSSMIRVTGRTALAVIVCALAAVPVFGAGWSRNFDDGTVQGLIELDPGLYQGVDEFRPSVVNGSLRLGFANLATNPPDNDSGLMVDGTHVMADTSALMLIKWSTNPRFAVTPTSSEMNTGFALRLDPNQLNGYVFIIDDRGYLQTQKLKQQVLGDVCPEGNRKLGMDPSKDWWLRAEVLNVTGGIQLRARSWYVDMPEPMEWQTLCLDDVSPLFPGGVVAIVANEDSASADNWVDLDNVSAGPLPELNCFNRIDDDGDGLTDCADPDCAGASACTCNDPFADIDGDKDVDQTDFGLWQLCYTGSAAGQFDASKCDCLDRDDMDADGFFSPDRDGDGLINLTDFNAFFKCFSGPTVPAPKTCDD